MQVPERAFTPVHDAITQSLVPMSSWSMTLSEVLFLRLHALVQPWIRSNVPTDAAMSIISIPAKKVITTL